MSRGLSAAAKNYTGPFVWALVLTLRDASVKNYAGEALTFLGVTYEAYLKSASATISRGLASDSGEVELLNTDLALAVLLKTKALEGAQGELKKLLLGIEEEYVVVKGLATEEAQTEKSVTLRIVSRLDAGGIAVPGRKFMGICQWRYKAPECGSVAAETMCDKDFAACTVRAATHRFSGMPSVSPELVRLVAQTPGTAPSTTLGTSGGGGSGGGGSDRPRHYPVPL